MIGAQAENRTEPVARRGQFWPIGVPLPASGRFALVGLCVWALALLVLARLPASSADAALGLYAREGGAQPFAWTSSQVLFPLRGGSGPTRVALRLNAGRWPGRQPPQITLASDGGALAAFVAPDQARTYRLLLPPDAGALMLRSTVEQPPGRDPRWLGVQLLGLEATASGWPMRAALDALKIALASLPLTLIATWSVRRGYAVVAALTGLGLLLRMIQLTHVPSGFFQDEAVSLVDAWHLAQTGRDHLGYFLPLGALEAFGDWISPLFTFLAVPVVALFGPSLLAGRLLAAILGALAIPAVYGLARALRLPKMAALCVALVVAISPWQILRTRVATPPALVPLCWTLLLWAALLFVRRGGRREALWLALAAGLGIYSYPTMKLAVPVLTGLAIVLAFVRLRGDRRTTNDERRTTNENQEPRTKIPISHPPSPFPHPLSLRSIARSWLPAALLLTLLWMPLASVTLLNPDSAMRAQSKLLRAETPIVWLTQWAAGYASYFLPAFYYQTGDPSNGMPGQGVQLPVEAPLALLGLGVLLWRAVRGDWRLEIGDWYRRTEQPLLSNLQLRTDYWLVLGALLIAPLPASLMFPNPHLTRALIAAPGYALLVGLGLAALLPGRRTTNDQRPTTNDQRRMITMPESSTEHRAPEFPSPISHPPSPIPHLPSPISQLRKVVPALVVLALLWQGGVHFGDYLREFPAVISAKYQDGMFETMRVAVQLASQYDEVWIDDRMTFPYIFVLAAQPMPPAQAQAQIHVQHGRTTFNTVTALGQYRFTNLAALPNDLPVREALPTNIGGPGFVLQEWSDDKRKILIVRRMRAG
jgi:hypothetical protein